ncbi:peptidoglycan-binding domain-containing protein [Pseudoxanthomonas sp. JBR18]|uniref:peptidoglycan-binding domain-containing protein n=1 Tax=Pseudoxanthomonas sp. JBR18 TaxID=2969308 RepID=UPI002304E3C3|nr:peptidoglycan-binding domain-containing protein [Pseudoxanthomonas sp. JBR18]WCE02562.1 peptidoglycan-binding domain-containing protein [Pseudoxanthomonas sp. JBR18]
MDALEQANAAVASWSLGQTSTRYETGGRGAGTVSSGAGDHGGVSYGSYQFSTNTGGVQEYLAQSKYGAQFSGLDPGTASFSAKWKEVAASDPGFASDQHDFIKSAYYDVQHEALKVKGIDLSDRGKAVQDALWSTSVQYRDLTPGIFEKGLQAKFGKDCKLSDITDEQIVGAIQDYKVDNVKAHFKSSPKLWNSLIERAESEKGSLVTLARYEDIAMHPDQNRGKTYREIYGEEPSQTGSRRHSDPMADGMLIQGERCDAVEAMQEKLAGLGAVGVDGRPLVADKDFGRNTYFAVEEFQRQQGLHVDGKAGPRTLAALDAAVRANSREEAVSPPLVERVTSTPVVTMADGGHPEHARYANVVQKLEGLEAQRAQAGLAPLFDDRKALENAAGQVAFESKVAGMRQVDAVVARPDGAGVFAVQGALGDPAAQRVYVDRAQAVGQDVAASTQQLEAFNRQFAIEQAQPNQVQAPAR